MWSDSSMRLPDDLLTFLDMSANEPDGLVRLAVVLDESRFALRQHDSYFDKALLSYAMHQIDFKALSPPGVLKMLDSEPYKGNSFARTAVLESLARAKMAVEAVEEAVKKKSSDADWKELLITAPQRGVDEWNAEAAKYKNEIQRSNAFEQKFWGPSRKALQGCWPVLRKDFLVLAKTLKHGNETEFKEALSDPIASLLFSRLAACAPVEQDKHYAEVLLRMSNDLRYARGPRLAAYYATLDALSKILADRTKFPVEGKDLGTFGVRALYRAGFDSAYKGRSGMGFVAISAHGVVKGVKKVATGVQISFATQKHQEMNRSCTQTGRILQFRPDGSPVYYEKCHDTGLVTVDDTAEDITVTPEWAEGIKPGMFLHFDAAIGQPPGRRGLPKTTYTDKNKKKLVNFYGFAL